ncbi:eIF3 subunit 6 protein [Ancylostoma caninum]|uniref:Eukaryotic translation initiation factor 3 subunit E n=1 Tax=Ancylostoma caninum TaxID=29170 RepID=A0A368H0V4_ANCCA|nr:eIF3 subunit 6 protein [Ancylostoma caninum]
MVNKMAEYDLTKRMAPFFDLHLIIPLLEFIEPRKIYDDASLVEMHRHVLMKTNMIDSLTETYQGTPIPKELETKRGEVLKERDILKAKVDPVIEILELDDVKELMESTRDRDGNNKILDFLQQNHNFQLDMIDALFKYAKFMYECGNYTAASVCLYYYRNLVPQADPNYLNALYGKLASEILLQEWDHARDDLVKLRAYIDSNPFDTEWELIHQRAWLMHWALFVYFNYPKGRDDIIEMFLNQQPYLNTIQVMCPHLLRYLAVAVVTSKNKQKNSLKDLIKVIDIERHNYQDPVTDFLTCLYIKYDFDEAQEKLRQCEEVLSNDFFLTGCLSDFRESARLLIFEMFCRIHQCISIEMLARRLNMSQVEAERWIVDLIRNYRIDGAKIDSKLGQVVMGVKAVSIHEQVIALSLSITFKSNQFSNRYLDSFMRAFGLFENPENHVPTLEEMKHTYAKKHGSILEKVSVLQPGTLLRLIIGENAFQRIHGTPLSSELHDKIRTIKEKHQKLDADRIATRCFPKFCEDGSVPIESYALKEPSFMSFMNGVLNYVVPKELLSSQQRTILIKFISERLLVWHSGTSLLASNEIYPMLEYAVIIKEVKKNLPKIWALCNDDKYLAQELLDGISNGLTHFIALYALHTLRSQTKVGLQGDLASFYYIPTYNRIKEHLSFENGRERTFSQCSSSTGAINSSDTAPSEPPVSGSAAFARQNIVIADKANASVQNLPDNANKQACSLLLQVPLAEEGVQRSNGSVRSNLVEDANPLPLKRVKLEPVGTGKTPAKLFPRDRPPDDIPIYDYTKVKRERFDGKFAQMETESRVSNSSSSHHVSGSGSAPVDEWDEVLRSINADPAVPTQYKVMFRCLVMSNRDLRDHNKILRSQLEKH